MLQLVQARVSRIVYLIDYRVNKLAVERARSAGVDLVRIELPEMVS